MKRTSKLPFNKETVRNLTAADLHAAQGGVVYQKTAYNCGAGTQYEKDTGTRTTDYNFDYEQQAIQR